MQDNIAEKLIQELTDLGDTISEAIGKLIKKEDNEEGSKGIQESLSQLTAVISKFKQIDLKPVVDIAHDISKQNVSILDLIGRLIHSQDNSVLIKMISDMVEKNNSFIERGFKKVDYTESLNLIASKLEKEEPMIDNFKVLRRDGLIETVTVNYKK